MLDLFFCQKSKNRDKTNINISKIRENPHIELKKLGKDNIDFTIGSALDLFGGTLEFEKIVKK